MVRFIFACMAFVALSVALTPVYYGIKNTKDKLAQREQVIAQNTDSSLSFEELYAIAATQDFDPASLNAIAPAAGDEAQSPAPEQEDQFSNGFSGAASNTLAD